MRIVLPSLSAVLVALAAPLSAQEHDHGAAATPDSTERDRSIAPDAQPSGTTPDMKGMSCAEMMKTMPGMTCEQMQTMQGMQAPAAPSGGHNHAGEPRASESASSGHDHGPAAQDAPLGTGPSVQSGMAGALGPYSMMRDASGTAWQPDSTPMLGLHGMLGSWTTMLHGTIYGIYDNQGGRRGDDKAFSASMFMAMAQRSWDSDALTFKTMISLDPAMGPSGYPLLLQTGETANGTDHLIDRQHPHDLFVELSAMYARSLSDVASLFVYAGLPGEPALGPPTFMHRASGMDNPEAPIAHHWLDSTHITYGVLTGGAVFGAFKLEMSAFNGREPDQHRWDFDAPRLDSYSARLSWNPASDWALQVSYGFIRSPEALSPDVDQRRVTASATYNRKFTGGNWQTSLAWGRNINRPGQALDAFLVESAVSVDRHTVFARGEYTEKDELFEAPDPLAGRPFGVGKFSAGYVYDIPVADHVTMGVGGLASVYALPRDLHAAYGASPKSFMLFARVKLV